VAAGYRLAASDVFTDTLVDQLRARCVRRADDHGEYQLGQESEAQACPPRGYQQGAALAHAQLRAQGRGGDPGRRYQCRQAEPALMRAAQNGVVHKNAASRKVSRLAHRIASLQKAS
jgi:hypothetical protein